MPGSRIAAAAGRTYRWGLVAVCLALLAASPGGVRADDAALDLFRYRGRVLVLDFWASWCKPCRQSVPWLNEMRSRYGAQGLVIVGVNVDEQRADAEKFLRDTPMDFEVIFDPTGQLARRYALQGMPTSLVFDRDGKLVASHIGFKQAGKATREADLLQLLQGKKP